MKRNNIDTKTPDFVWNQNRLMLEKERIKKEMMGDQEEDRQTNSAVKRLMTRINNILHVINQI